ncbi:hypothetical protein H5410_057518 [Solanum commersonii]|uniref:Uncharacterized protein n=1 Tax=Solanum commersonii TaxID=4109 RepID=A0A9J5WQU4_SOLCO|nr:hypothetical protein H5410_057518 [Solanum commersonii]
MKNGRKRELKRSLEELRKENESLLKEGKSIARIITSQILATNVEDLAIMPKIIESRKRLKALM